MDKSLFISGKLHEKKIMTPKGEVTIWLKELPNTAYLRLQSQLQSTDHQVRAEAMQRIVSLSVCDADGEVAMDFDQACLLKIHVLNQIFSLVMGLGKDDDVGNDSPPAEKSGSGTPSPSPSAGSQ